jgi:hypothetical protein
MPTNSSLDRERLLRSDRRRRVRSNVDRVAEVGLVGVIAGAGVVAALTPVLVQGLVLGGSACGGAGNAQRCTAIARHLSLVDVSPRAWAYVVGGAAVVLGAAAPLFARPSVRSVLLLTILCIAFLGLVQTTDINARLGPSGGGTYGRAVDEWGAFLSPALVDLREDALRRYAGRRTEPGGPRYERAQILDSFSVHRLDGWRYLYAAVVVLFFAAGLGSVHRIVRRPVLAIVITGTAGSVLWAMVADEATQCEPDTSECSLHLATILALAGAAATWSVYLAGIGVGRIVRRLVSSARLRRAK